MIRTRRATYAQFLAIFLVVGSLGLGGAIYVLVRERAVLPFQNVYSVKAAFAEASGVNGGVGQPVNVVGVKVGQVTGVRLLDGRAVVTMQIDRGLLSHVYRNASATLEPITPLKDMQIELNPGDPSEPVLTSHQVIGLAATSAPVPLEDLLSRLDLDTRTYLSTLIATFDQGTAGRADDLRRALAALAPSAAQARRLSVALAGRRTELARLVHNLAVLSRAAAADGHLRTVIAAGNRTLDALVTEDRPLRDALRQLPGTLNDAAATLTLVRPFARALGPTVQSLTPAVRNLPSTLASLGRLADRGTPALAEHVRPFVRDAVPLARDLSPAVSDLTQATPHLTAIGQTLNYTLNELAYNPPGDDEGFLFWTAWALHNLDSALSTGDAHGTVLRVMLMATCEGAQANTALKPLFKVLGTCPN